jgi:hypothetical protein
VCTPAAASRATATPWAELPAWLDGARGRGRGKLGSSIGRGKARATPRGQGAAALDMAELGRRGGVEERISGALGLVSAEKKRNGGAGIEARPVRSAEAGGRAQGGYGWGETWEEEKSLTHKFYYICIFCVT